MQHLKGITVNGAYYIWAVKHDIDGDGSNRLTIWRDNKIIYEEVHRGEITPIRVANFIGEVTSAHKI